MQTLKNCMSGKMIQWITEADEAFRRMKELLEALPTVIAPVNGKTLIVYLAASKESIRAVLMAERGKKKVPVYFVSRTLHGAELEYPGLEKLILALILARPKKSGCIAKWAIELGEHKIEFRGRNSIKGQILADFLAETPPKKEIKNGETKMKEPESENAWKLFTDGASRSDGSRVGLMLVDPEGKEYTYALRFEFKTTNNEAKYEALLARLRIAKEMKIQELIIFVDSQLVANQVNGLFEARKTPDDPQRARKLRVKVPLYKLMDGTLYRISYLSPWLRCVVAAQAKDIIQELSLWIGSCNIDRDKCGNKKNPGFRPSKKDARMTWIFVKKEER
ncbi:reverse transcriptase domain-containing protein [Tanacetum coccineum]